VGLIVGVVVGVLVAAVAVAGIFFVSRDTGQPTSPRTIAGPTQTSPGTTSSPPRPSQSSAPRTPTRTPSTQPTPSPPDVPAVVPGWTAVESRELVAYDVPPDWKVEEGSLLTGFQAPGGLVIMHNSATFKDGACPADSSSSRGRAGLVSPKGQPAKEAAAAISKQWAEVAALDDGGTGATVGGTTVTTVTVAAGSTEATAATTVLTIPHPQPCQAPSMTFTAVSFEVKGQVVVFMLYLDQGMPDALPQDVAARIIGSLRPIGP
jgi:hypothetical protein